MSIADEVQFFHENGYLGPFKVYEEAEAEQLIRTVRRKNLDRSRALFNNEVNYDRHFDISELSQHILHPAIVSRMNAILGAHLLCWRSEFFPKFPGTKGTEWHQVETFQYTTGNPQLVPTERGPGGTIELTAWTVFTESDKENGCLKFLPGSHRKWQFDESKTPKRGRAEGYNPVESETSFYGYDYEDFKIDPSWTPDEDKAEAMIMRPGECVIFTAKCIHGSFPNTSKRRTRFAITTRYVPTTVKVYPERNEFHEHGGHFDLTNYGTVLVSGEDKHGYNRIRATDNLGDKFEWAPKENTESAPAEIRSY
ncbi:MAG: hypothetical protein RL701_3698 [Pseudomonadota bacterium]|jgi:non-heme Fe2+,alpha-ketoglutarate-dependent halogenase